jgi:hypothetical protein
MWSLLDEVEKLSLHLGWANEDGIATVIEAAPPAPTRFRDAQFSVVAD